MNDDRSPAATGLGVPGEGAAPGNLEAGLRDSHGEPATPLDAVRSWLAVSDHYRAENGDALDEHELWALRDLADCLRVYLDTLPRPAAKLRHDLDRSVAFTLLLEYYPGWGDTVDDGGRDVTRFLDDWYGDPSLDMGEFARRWVTRQGSPA